MDEGFDWAIEFDAISKDLIEKRDHRSLFEFKNLGKSADLSIPTPDHYFPLLYPLALSGKDEPIRFFAEKCVAGSISMRSFIIG